jgi:hypothetical protein
LDEDLFEDLSNLEYIQIDNNICVLSYILKYKFVISPQSNSFFEEYRVGICTKLTFKDIKDSEYKYEIEYLATQKYINGYADNMFKPNNKINRYEFIKILANTSFLKNKNLNECKKSFIDVKDNQWFSPYICLAKKYKIITGYVDNTFRGEQYITFAEALSVLFKVYNIEVEESLPWYKSYLDKYEKLSYNSIELNNYDFLTREEVAKLIYQFDTGRFD